MVNNRRSSFEIMNKIVNVSKDGARKTEILYQSNLSYNQLNEYLSLLKEKDILKEEYVEDNGSSHSVFYPTDKGRVFVEDVRRVLKHLG